jgi:uncharacterized protein YdaU (DUF1376 family)
MQSSSVRDYLVARLDALLADCDLVINNAHYGQTVHDLDDFFLLAGKQFTKEVFQQKLQEHIERTEKKKNTSNAPNAKRKRTSKIKKKKRSASLTDT